MKEEALECMMEAVVQRMEAVVQRMMEGALGSMREAAPARTVAWSVDCSVRPFLSCRYHRNSWSIQTAKDGTLGEPERLSPWNSAPNNAAEVFAVALAAGLIPLAWFLVLAENCNSGWPEPHIPGFGT